jgi:adenine-specific DNA-methyltransferase
MVDTELGKVYTPPAIADLTLALALEGLPPDARVLDPACGDGVFLARARAAGYLGARGIEIDPEAAAAARAHGPVEHGDFLEVAPPARLLDLLDAVVGNPPYVRQERLGERKARIQRRMALDYPELPERWLGGRSDLALAFLARALRFVRPGGRVGFVVSAALLDAGYGAALEALLRGRARVRVVVASPRERWFRGAAVNAVVLVLEKELEQGRRPEPARVARLRVPVAEAHPAGIDDLARFAEVRRVPAGAPLAPLLRAPAVWFEAAASAALVPLGELAEVSRGVTSGANGFFYLSREQARGIEPRFLAPLLRSPRQISRIGLDARRLPTLAFVCDLAAAELAAHPGARRHVERHAAVAARPTLAARARWWALPARPARLFLTKAYAARFAQPLATRPVIGDQRLYAVAPRRGVSLPLLAAALNGTLCALALESLGRASLGEGALELAVADAARLPVLDVRRIPAAAVLAAFRPLARRAIGDVFAEAGRPDRRALDDALAAAFPELAALGPRLAPALAELVTDRLDRASTVPSC